MKTRQSTGYFQQVFIRLLLCFISSVVFACSAHALTGNNINQCYDCHGSLNDIRPVDYAYRNITTGGFVGNHRTHMSTATTSTNVCATCHDPSPSVMYHRDDRIYLNNGNIKNGTYSKGPFFNQTSIPVLGTCSSVNCHFNTATPSWGASPSWSSTKTANDLNANCAQCHSATTLATGKHTKHIAAGGGTQTACRFCHPDYNAAAGTAAFQHATSAARPINIDFSAAPNLGGTYTGGRTATQFLPPGALVASGTCSSIYCHSSGKKGLIIATVTIEPPNPSWNSAALDCEGCHGRSTGGTSFASSAGEPNYPNQGANVAGSNSHQRHVGTSGAATTCINCHNSTVTAAGALKAGNTHTDKTINVVPGNSKILTWTAATKTCSNISCHFNGSAQWGATALACNACHGGPAALGSNIIASNKHTVHINNIALGTNYTCGECHAKTITVGNDTAISTAANHANSFNDYSGAEAYKSGYTVGSLTTCTTYCHSSGKKGLVGMAATVEPTNPSWNAVAQPLDCEGCHGAKTTPTAGVQFNSIAGEPNYTNGGAGAANANSHLKHVGTAGASTCTYCHSKTTTTGTTLVAGGQHTDRFINYTAGGGKTFGKVAASKTCSNISCHVGGTAQWGATLACNACHGGPAALGSNIIASNKHTVHINNAAILGTNYTCGECHAKTVTVGNDTAISNAANHANSLVNYSGAEAYKSGYTVGSLTTCITYCHSSGKKGQAGVVATVEPANPSWNAAAQPLVCNGCHGARTTPTGGVAFNSVAGEPNYTNGGSGVANANSHLKHVGAAGASTCANCHSKTTTTGTTLVAGGQHTDKFINYTAGNGKTFGRLAGKTCSNISCHGGNGIIAVVSNATWGSTLSCAGCHGDATSNTLTAPHDKHLNNSAQIGTNFGCVDCHAKTVSDNSTISNVPNHGNAFRDYSGIRAGGSATYNQGTNSCSASYCHSSGKKGQAGMVATVEPTAPVWAAAALGCKGCHGAKLLGAGGVSFTSVAGEPNYVSGVAGATNANSHQKHVGATGAATCDTCHTNTTTNGTVIKAGSAIHADKTINVNFNTTKAGAGVTWTSGTKTCSTTACHGRTTPRWGETSSGCNYCHPYDVGTWNTTAQRWNAQISATSEGFGAHEKHITHLKTLLGKSLNVGVAFGLGVNKEICGACHTNTAGNHMDVAAGNARSLNFGDATYTYGLAGFDLKFGGNPTYGGNSATSSSVNPKNCLNTSCHTGTAPVWAPY